MDNSQQQKDIKMLNCPWWQTEELTNVSYHQRQQSEKKQNGELIENMPVKKTDVTW